MAFQRTESAGLLFAEKHLVAFPPASLLILGKDPVVVADIIELIIMLADHIDSIRGFIGNTLIQPCFRGHASKHRVKLRYLRARPHPPPVEMNPDQGAIAVRAAVGNVKHLTADYRLQRRFFHPFTIRRIDRKHCVLSGDGLEFLRAVTGQLRHAVGEKRWNKNIVLHFVAGDSAGDGIDQMIHLQLGFLQIRNIVENTVKQRMPLVLAKGADLDAHPDEMPVAVHLAEFQSRRNTGTHNLHRPGHDALAVLRIDSQRGILKPQRMIVLGGISA